MSTQNKITGPTTRLVRLDHQAKQIIYNTHKFYKKRKLDKTTYEHQQDVNLVVLVSEITGVKQGSVKRIIQDGNAMMYEDGVAVFKPKEKKKATRKKRIAVNELTLGIIRRKFLQVPNLRKLHKLLKEGNILHCSQEFLRQVLRRLGVSAEKYPGLLRENADILAERMCYLETAKEQVEQGRSVFYLSNTKDWAGSESYTRDMPSFVMLHTNGPGFLDKVQLMLKTKPTSADDECFEHFENYDWMRDIVLPNIPPASVVIVDVRRNASLDTKLYDKLPTADSPISDLKSWLGHHNVSFTDTASTSELMELVKSQEAKVEFSITKLIEESGHLLLHLPQNHSDLNPVAVMWYNVTMDVLETSVYDLFTKYSKKSWEDCISHVKENEAEYYAYGLKANDPDYMTKRQKSQATPSPSDSDNEDSINSSS